MYGIIIDFKYLARVGNDAYFRPDYFWNDIHPTLPQDEPLYIGRFRSEGEVMEESLKESLGISHYPTYALGMGFILTYDVAEYLTRAARILPFHTGFPEDAMVSLWLVGTRTKRVNLPDQFHDVRGNEPFHKFHNPKGGGANSKACDERSVLIHYMHKALWKAIDERGVASC